MAGFGWDDADRDALEILRPLLDAGYLPWSEWALRPAALAAVCNEIVVAGRRQVVELGSGVSTVVLGRLLGQRGGRLTSVEHDPAWADVVRGLLESDGRLTEGARLIEGPLEPHPLALDGAHWYPESALAELPVDIDLLLVDGPPGNDEGIERSRYPALPAINERLAPGAIVVLDDAERQGEQAILERWGADHPEWNFSTRDEGIAIGVRSA